jgi:hypothetical protein
MPPATQTARTYPPIPNIKQAEKAHQRFEELKHAVRKHDKTVAALELQVVSKNRQVKELETQLFALEDAKSPVTSYNHTNTDPRSMHGNSSASRSNGGGGGGSRYDREGQGQDPVPRMYGGRI